MREGMQCLLEVLRGQYNDRAVGDAELEAALVLAEQEHVLPWAAARLRTQAATPSLAMEDRLRKIERNAAIVAFYWSSQLKGVLQAFNESKLVVVPLKGPLLAKHLYGGTALRGCRDLDLLVAKADVARAEAVLAAMGFVPDDADDYHRQWFRQTTTIELHHDVENPLAFDFDVEGALRRAHPADFEGQPCNQLSPEDELLFLCLHAARHRYEHLGLIVDLQLAFQKLQMIANDWQPRREVAGFDGLLLLGLTMARRLQPDLEVSAQFVFASERQREHLERLADHLWEGLLKGRDESLDWRAVHAFYVEMELPGWPRLHRRYRHLRILAGRLIAPDYAFAARFGLSRVWQVRMLRPLRLLSEHSRVVSAEAESIAKPVVSAGVRLDYKHPLAIRWMHWVNFPVLFTMIWSGLLIYWNDSDNAYKHPHAIYRIGIGNFTLIRFFPEWFYQKLQVPYHVTQGLGYHFFFMWIFALNGIAYVLYMALSGEWRFVIPERRSLRDAIQVTLVDLHLRKGLPEQKKYNGAQRIAYTSVILMGVGMLVTGLAIYKPTQAHWLTTMLGGYEMARWLHFWITMSFLGFFVVHVGQVVLAGWNNFRSMVSGREIQRVQASSTELERRSWR